MNILLMQQLAKDKQEELDHYGEDWKSKIEALPATIEMVKGWQNAVFDKFGQPRVHGTSRNEWRDVKAGEVLRLNEVSLEKTEFKGATLVQALGVDWDKPNVKVTYKTVLMTDENHFLREMLPKTVDVPLHDPAYDLITLEVEIPREQLVRESIFALDNLLVKEQATPVIERQVRKSGRWAGHHWQGLAIISAIAVAGFGIYSVGSWVSTLPPSPPPVDNAMVNTTTSFNPLLMFGALDPVGMILLMIIFMIPLFIMRTFLDR